jgi:prepilin-type N-terminal cleavage/methylation domain-containing protein
MQKGFTIIELLIVIAIIALIGAVIILNIEEGTQKSEIPDDKSKMELKCSDLKEDYDFYRSNCR